MTLANFKDKNVVPPGNKYFYIVPETEMYFETLDRYSLEKEIRIHYQSNNISPPDNLPGVIEDYMCRHLPEEFCKNMNGSSGRKWLSSSKIRNFTQVFFKRMHSHALVPEKVADARAKTCMTCPLNMKNICSTCNGLGGLAKKMLRVPRSTAFDATLGACECCGCLLQVKIHVPIEDLNVKDLSEYPDHCWLRTETEAATVDAPLEQTPDPVEEESPTEALEPETPAEEELSEALDDDRSGSSNTD